jgi:O-antigen ligase
MSKSMPVGWFDRVAYFTLLALLVLAPLFRSGKTPTAVMVLELLAIFALVLLFWRDDKRPPLSLPERVLALALLALPLLQLFPLPGLSRLSLPGQADYYSALQLVGAEAFTSLTILPRETFLGWLVLSMPLAVFMLVRRLPPAQVRMALAVVFAMAAAQAMLGLLQYGTGPDSPFMVGMDQSGGLSKGTWRGRNSYANFLDMVLMTSLAMFFATLGRHRRASGSQTLREKIVYFSTLQGHKAFLYGAFSVLLLLAVVFSRSRAGIGLSMVGIVLVGTLLSRRIGGENIYGLAGTVVSVGLAFAIAIGLGPVWERFAARSPMEDGRWTTFDGLLEGIGQFFPLGSGSGTFQQVFPPFQDLSQSAYTMNQAHNSYLEWLFNAGIFGAVLIVGFLAWYLARWFTLWKRGRWGDFRYLQVGAGLAMLLTLMHEMVDFNLFVPANLIYFAFFAGVFFYPYEEPVKPPRQRRRTPSPESTERARPALQPVSTEPERNPFMDD